MTTLAELNGFAKRTDKNAQLDVHIIGSTDTETIACSAGNTISDIFLFKLPGELSLRRVVLRARMFNPATSGTLNVAIYRLRNQDILRDKKSAISSIQTDWDLVVQSVNAYTIATDTVARYKFDFPDYRLYPGAYYGVNIYSTTAGGGHTLMLESNTDKVPGPVFRQFNPSAPFGSVKFNGFSGFGSILVPYIELQNVFYARLAGGQ